MSRTSCRVCPGSRRLLAPPLSDRSREGRIAAVSALGLAAGGAAALLVPSVGWVCAGLALVGVGTFFALAVTTGFVGRAAPFDRGAASGLYLAAYLSGELAIRA